MGRTRRAVAVCLAALVVAGCGAGDPLDLPTGGSSEVARPATAPPREPEGTITVAYPEVPASWLGIDGDDPAAIDLAALWGLPLYRYGPDGVLRPALAAASITGSDADGWFVDVGLRSGRWSDGTPVSAKDVVATIDALRASASREAEFTVVDDVEVIDERTVRIRFGEPYHRWPHLLSGGAGVLPAHVLESGGLDAFSSGVPVAGGWFVLEEFEAGLRAVFAAHTDGPLGAPGVERVEILFTPRFETSLGLIDDGRVDVVLGHLALNPVGRAERLDGAVDAAAPLGGTTVALEWPADDVPVATRRAVAEAVDVEQLVEGLLGPTGEVTTSPWPEVAGPWRAGEPSTPEGRSFGTLQLLIPRWQEVVGFTSRAIQRDLGGLDGTLEITSRESPDFVEVARTDADVVLRIRRDGPRPALARMVAAVTPEVRAADRAAFATSRVVDAGFEEVAAQARIRPLYRVGVAHVWRTGIRGVRPSSWPGLAFWNVGGWQLDDA